LLDTLDLQRLLQRSPDGAYLVRAPPVIVSPTVRPTSSRSRTNHRSPCLPP